MSTRNAKGIPPDLRQRLEQARLQALALFRALDRVQLSAQEIPQEILHELFELDADFAEALWALDQPPHSLDFRAMVRDTLDSLATWPEDRQTFLNLLPSHILDSLDHHVQSILGHLDIQEAYEGLPGLDGFTDLF